MANISDDTKKSIIFVADKNYDPALNDGPRTHGEPSNHDPTNVNLLVTANPECMRVKHRAISIHLENLAPSMDNMPATVNEVSHIHTTNGSRIGTLDADHPNTVDFATSKFDGIGKHANITHTHEVEKVFKTHTHIWTNNLSSK